MQPFRDWSAGGFAGVELAGALNDFARGILSDYPNLQASDVSVTLVHSRDRILPELSESLAAYALERMTARGVTFRLAARVADAAPGCVTLASGETIACETLVWTAGTTPNPLLRTVDLATDRRGAAIVDSTLAVADRPNVWALGDCAAVADAKTGAASPPTAQFALRQAQTLARNIAAAVEGGKRMPSPFHFESLGSLCAIGYQTACAELNVPLIHGRTFRFSGFFAWMLWRTIYLGKLPTLERKLRVSVDWTIELFFPRDIVETIDSR